MAGEALAALQTIIAAQSVFQTFDSTFKFGAFLCPVDTPIQTIIWTSYDFIIVGSGTAGSVLAYRLSQCPYTKVLLIEAGTCPPLESLATGLQKQSIPDAFGVTFDPISFGYLSTDAAFLGYFPYLPRTKLEYNMTNIKDNGSNQNIQGKVASLTAGKMLGGSSSIQHNLHVVGAPADYNPWAAAANDSSWAYDNLLQYFKKSEKLTDKPIYKKYSAYHGTKGPIKTKRQIDPLDEPILEAFGELGYEIRIDTNNNNGLGVVEPLLELDETFRQGGLVSYLSRAKDRPNLHVLSNAFATKILFNIKKVATGVQLSYQGRTYTAKAKKEVIVSAGALKSPQLLMLSGIGPADHLKSKNIPVIVDLPVGKYLLDHIGASIIIGLEKNSSAAPALSPLRFPTALTSNYVNVDNASADFAQCQGINLLFYQNSQGLMGLCLNVFKYTTEICQKWYDANVNRRIFYSVIVVGHPESRGELILNTTNIEDQPIIDVGYFRNKSDLVTLGKCLGNSIQLLNTTYFKKIKAKFYDLDLCTEYKKFSKEYLECYGEKMSTTLWHYSGTVILGKVVDAKLLVKGVSGLRVVDASIMPSLPGGNINAAVLAVGEKAAADIIDKYGCKR